MDNLSITEGLYILAADESDATNIVAKVRRGQARVMEYTGGRAEALHTVRTADEVDDILIMASRNGAVDLFA